MSEDVFTISLDAADGSYIVQVEPMDNNGTMQYILSVLEDNTGPFQQAWHALIEHDGVKWKQAPESVERGPNLPEFLIEEIGDQIENHFK